MNPDYQKLRAEFKKRMPPTTVSSCIDCGESATGLGRAFQEVVHFRRRWTEVITCFSNRAIILNQSIILKEQTGIPDILNGITEFPCLEYRGSRGINHTASLLATAYLWERHYYEIDILLTAGLKELEYAQFRLGLPNQNPYIQDCAAAGSEILEKAGFRKWPDHCRTLPLGNLTRPQDVCKVIDNPTLSRILSIVTCLNPSFRAEVVVANPEFYDTMKKRCFQQSK